MAAIRITQSVGLGGANSLNDTTNCVIHRHHFTFRS